MGVNALPLRLECTVNGQPGSVAQQDGITMTVFAFDIADDRITHIWAVRNPERLRPWTTGWPATCVASGPAATRGLPPLGELAAGGLSAGRLRHGSSCRAAVVAIMPWTSMLVGTPTAFRAPGLRDSQSRGQAADRQTAEEGLAISLGQRPSLAPTSTHRDPRARGGSRISPGDRVPGGTNRPARSVIRRGVRRRCGCGQPSWPGRARRRPRSAGRPGRAGGTPTAGTPKAMKVGCRSSPRSP